MISLKQIHYALAVEKHLHFKNAAEACHVSQSALSTAITELEKHLGFQVFERDNKKVLVTPTGRQFLERAALIGQQVDDLEHLALTQKQPLSYPMTLGVIPTIGPYLLPRVLPELRQEYPHFPLRLIEETSAVLVDMVRKGDIDSAILALPYALDGLLSFEFWQEDFYWITHRDDAHAGQTEITSDKLNASQLMLLKEGHCLKDHALAACRLQAPESLRAFGSTSLHTLVQMVAGKMGSTLVPEMALETLVNPSDELKAVHLNEPGPHRRIAFVVRPNYTGMASIEVLRRVFREGLGG
jgi:LysR family hydrogen peroxide-inducible transcriptional activator